MDSIGMSCWWMSSIGMSRWWMSSIGMSRWWMGSRVHVEGGRSVLGELRAELAR